VASTTRKRTVARDVAKRPEKPREPTEQELLREKILAELDALGGAILGEDDIVFQGTKMVLPEAMAGDLDAVIETLIKRRDDEAEHFEFSRTYPYRPYDGAAAFQRAIIRVFGMSPAGKPWKDMFGQQHLPQLISVNIGPNRHIQVPWDMFHLEWLEADFTLGHSKTREGIVFTLYVEAPRRQQKRVEAFMVFVEEELRERSIYRGKALTGDDGVQLGFFDPNQLDRAKVVYNQDVMDQLDANVWTPIEHADLLRSLSIPLRRAVLLEGPNGTGKTSAGVLTAQKAVQHGWTFIRVPTGEDPLQALSTARQYAPAVVWFEDIDELSAGKTRGEVSKLMDVLDNVQSKNADVVAVFTSNFPELIEKGVLRPGRIDSVIHVGALDADGAERLIKALLPEGMLAANVDFEKVGAACEGYLPAFLTEVVHRAVRYAVARTKGLPDVITTSDLCQAADGLRPQLQLMLDAGQANHEKAPPLDESMAAVVEKLIQNYRLNPGTLTFERATR
jgi:transitional endoplasmic reticulum ATPase